MTIHVGLDLDGCMYPFIRGYNRNYAPDKTEQDWTEFYAYRKWGVTDDQFKGHLKSGARWKGLYDEEAPYVGVIGAWERLKALPVKTHVITYRPREAWGPTIAWLEAFGFQPDTLSFSSDKTILRALAGSDATALLMCEDTVSQFLTVEEAGIDVYLIDQPWNREHETRKRVADFSAFVDKVEEAVYG